MRTVLPKNAKLLPASAECVFQGQIFDVYHWQQEVFDGTTETFEMLKRPDTIKVIAIKVDQIVVLDEQQPHQPAFIDIPGGRHDHNEETELDAAKRELLEETGMKFKNWRLLSVEQPHSKIEWFVYIFVASRFESQADQKLDSGEKITVKMMSLDELKALADKPETRYLPKDILDKAKTIDDLFDLPEYVGVKL